MMHTVLTLTIIAVVASVVRSSVCERFGIPKSTLTMDVEWVMQGYQIGFQGFFVELLGFTESITRLMPQARLVKSSFKKSFTESPFAHETLFMEKELFAEEEVILRRLVSSDAVASADVEFPKFMGTKQAESIACDDPAKFESEQAYIGGELAKSTHQGIATPTECCQHCAANPLCLAWTHSDGSKTCSLKGKMDQNVTSAAGCTSGKMIAHPPESSMALNAAAGPNPQTQRPRRRSPVPRAIVFHGTTCIHQNRSASMANRDINTILIGRYMLERSNLNGGYNLDEYAVMHCAARMDEIWVPTEWHRGVFERLFAQQGSASSMPLIAVIPEAVDTTLFDPHYAHQVSTRTIVGEDRVYVADATRLSEQQLLSDTNRMAVRKECTVTDKGVACEDGQKFEFLSIFKWEYRKGWDVMLDAYWAAFKPTDDVVLRVRSYVPHTSAGDRNITRVIEAYAQRTQGKPLSDLARVVWENGVEGFTVPFHSTPAPEVVPTPAVSTKSEQAPSASQDTPKSAAADVTADGAVVVDSATDLEVKEEEPETHLTREDMRALLASANAFVLATRGEGWGLPIAEAMAMALPVIVTNHSGPAAFADASNAYLVNVQPDLDEFSFAKPKAEDLVAQMRQVIADSSSAGGHEAQKRGLRAREKMKEISADSIVCKMNERLRFHAMRRGWDMP